MRTLSRVAFLAAYAASVAAAAGDDSPLYWHDFSDSPPSTPTEKPPWKKLRKARRNDALLHYWYIIIGIVFGTFVLRLFSLARARAVRRRVVRSRRGSGSREQLLPQNVSRAVRHRPSHRDLLRAKSAAFENLAYVQIIPLSIYSRGTVAEWVWTLGYAGITLSLGAYASYFRGELDYANPMGMIAVAQLPFIVGLAGRNNVISALTGVSYERLSFLHRAAGRTCVLTTALHVVGWLIKGLGKHGPWSWRFNTSLPAAIGLGMMYLTSFQRVRNAMWEFFLVVHISMGIMFLVGTYYHTPEYRQWVWPSLVMWGLDRFAGMVRLINVNAFWARGPESTQGNNGNGYALVPGQNRDEEACRPVGPDGANELAGKVERVGREVMRITLHRPLLKWVAGTHVYVSMPDVSGHRAEQHPFTIANIPDDTGDMVLILRAHEGFTRRLLDRVPHGEPSYFRTYIEGPYGTPPGLDHYDSLLLVAGGTGAAYTLSYLLDIIRSARARETAVSAVRFVWNVRDVNSVQTLAPLLNDALSRTCPEIALQIDIHVTRSAASDEPQPESSWREGGRALSQIDPHPDGGDGEDTPTTLSRSASGTALVTLRNESRNVSDTCLSRLRNEVDVEGEAEVEMEVGVEDRESRPVGSAGTHVDRIAALRGLGLGRRREKTPAATQAALAQLAGLSPAVTRHTMFHAGRSHLDTILRHTVRESRSEGDGVAMVVCGPTALVLDARLAVCNVNTTCSVLRGQNSVAFYSGNFGF